MVDETRTNPLSVPTGTSTSGRSSESSQPNPPPGLPPQGLLSRWLFQERPTLAPYLTAAGVVIAITFVFLQYDTSLGHRAIALIYLFAVVVLASFVGRGPTLLAAAMSALLWDYFFMVPIHTFRITNFEDALLLGMYFVVALVLGQLTARIRAQEKTRRLGEEQATVLYLLTRELTEADHLDQMLQKVVQSMERVFKAQIAMLLPGTPNRLQLHPHSAGTFMVSDGGQRVAAWAFQHNEPAGKFTGHSPQADALHVPLAAGGSPVGVMGLRFFQSAPPTAHQWNLLTSATRQIALALDRHRLREVSERAKLLAESERLSKTLLDSMSHEIRTPIAAIDGALSNLAALRQTDSPEAQQAMIAEAKEAAARLNRLVGKVLDITRLETGHVKPKINECDVRDLVHTTVAETEKELVQHRLSIELAPDLPIVWMDFVLMQEALANLLSNAASHTPPGTEVRVSARVDEGALLIEVADRGPGIDPKSLGRMFEKFFRGPGAPTGGTGLGLSLVRGFVEAQGGQVSAENRAGGGALFTIRLPPAKLVPAVAAANL